MRTQLRSLATLAILAPLGVIALTSTAAAQDETVKKGDFVDDKVAAAQQEAEADKSGWDASLSVGASFNLIDNRNVVGQTDGSTFTAGGTLVGGLDYTSEFHNIDLNLNFNETFTQTTAIDEFVNTADLLQLDGAYYFKIPNLDWLGPFARAELRTSVFPGYDARAVDRNYNVTPNDGGEVTTETTDRFRIRDPFAPIFLKQSIGAFARPITKDYLKLEVRLGGGARQVFADGQFAVTEAAATGPIAIKELSDFNQIGAEAAIMASGAFQKKRITYSASLQALTPFYNSVSTEERGPLDLTEVEFDGKISLKIVEWASLDYQLRVLRQPLLIDDIQVQNNLLLTFGYTLLGE